MLYQPSWLRLGEARAHLMASSSLTESDAEAWILRAIQDQLRVDPESYNAQTMFRVQGFPTRWRRRRFPRDWPARLTPDRIDWEASTIRGPDPERLIENDMFIEVSATALRGSPTTAAAVADVAVMSKREAAKIAIDACYPHGLPPTVLNSVLCRTVGDWLKKNMPQMPDISDDTIERAGGRK